MTVTSVKLISAECHTFPSAVNASEPGQTKEVRSQWLETHCKCNAFATAGNEVRYDLNQDEPRKREAINNQSEISFYEWFCLFWEWGQLKQDKPRKREAINNQSQREPERLPVTLILRSGTKGSLQLSWIKLVALTIGSPLDHWVTTAQCEVK